MSGVRVFVAGSVNLDLVVRCEHLPLAGETVMGADVVKHPGGKGANQALAARRLGAETALIACVGADPEADAALALLARDGVDLSAMRARTGQPTGVALIAVGPDGDNQIVVAPGANSSFTPDDLPDQIDGALIAQLEIPPAVLDAAVARCAGFVTLNLAPAGPVSDAALTRADLIVVNEGEAEAYTRERLFAAGGLTAITLGARGAVLFRDGVEIARAAPPAVVPVDATGAGDAFVGALSVALVEGQPPEEALRFACAAGALSTTRPGAQGGLAVRSEVEACLNGAQ